MDLAVVLATYNRLPLLQRCIASVRRTVGALSYRIIVVDGGSSDGSREWLRRQYDLDLIEQPLPLTGAVAAFNLGFGRAVDLRASYVAHLNDDSEVKTDDLFTEALGSIQNARQRGNVAAGAPSALAFATNTRGSYGFEEIHGKPYSTFGLVRRGAGMAVARAQGDQTGRAWWNPIYRTYGADSEFGCWLWKLGYWVHGRDDLRVADLHAQDALRAENDGDNPNRLDSLLFWSRWPSPDSLSPSASDP